MNVYKALVVILMILNTHIGTAATWTSTIPGSSYSFTAIDRSTSQRLIVKYKNRSGLTPSSTRANSLASKYQAQLARQFKSTPNIVVLSVDPTKTEQILGQLLRDPDIEYVERDQPIEMRTIANDTRFNEQWALKNNEYDSDINAEQAWSMTTGNKAAVVAVIDTGIAYTHVDLKTNIWTNPGEIAGDGIDNDNNGKIDDIHGYDAGDNDSDPYDDKIGHGTHVAGIIGAQGNNNALVSGINWDTSILACKIFSANTNSISGFVSNALECLDYVWDLKQNHGINIIATNNSWGWVGAASKALAESIDKQKEAGILFVAAAGNRALNNDEITDNPSSYHNSNIIAVASSNQFSEQSFFTNYGPHSVHISAPGEGILSTFPGITPGSPSTPPSNAVFFDGFEQGLINWTGDSYWSISNSSYLGSSSVVFTPLGNGAVSSSLISNSIDLSTNNEALDLNFSVNFFSTDYSLDVDISSDGVNWNYLTTVYKNSSTTWQSIHVAIPDTYYLNGFQIRFSPVYDYVDTAGFTLSIDEVSIAPHLQHPDDNAVRYASGTSMASPAVVGAIALLYAQNSNRDWKQLKNLIIAGAKPFDSGSAQTISNRRLRLSDVDGTGSMTCVNQQVQKVLAPRKSEISFSAANPSIHLEYLNIDCDMPNATNSVLIKETGIRVSLNDNGSQGIDQSENDGVFSAVIDLFAIGLDHLTLEFPDGETIQADKSDSYLFETNTAYRWREISNPINLQLDNSLNDPAFVTAPFPIQFAGKQYSQFYVSLYGFISFYYPRVGLLPTFLNTELPSLNFEPAIFPLWNDYQSTNANVVYGINGNPPNREMVIQWSVIPLDPASSSATPGSFQVVFSESSSEILFNYGNLDFNLESYNNGITATVGIQTSSSSASSYDSALNPINSNSAMLWRSNNNVNQANSKFFGSHSDNGGYFGSFDGISAICLLIFFLLGRFNRKLHRRRGCHPGIPW